MKKEVPFNEQFLAAQSNTKSRLKLIELNVRALELLADYEEGIINSIPRAQLLKRGKGKDIQQIADPTYFTKASPEVTEAADAWIGWVQRNCKPRPLVTSQNKVDKAPQYRLELARALELSANAQNAWLKLSNEYQKAQARIKELEHEVLELKIKLNASQAPNITPIKGKKS